MTAHFANIFAACAIVVSGSTILMPTAFGQTSQVYEVCHGEFESQCKAHPYDKFEPCSFNGSGANPPLSVAYLCGTKPGGKANGSWSSSGFPSVSGNNCGYSWFEVRCY
jgi:hypothetical protein